MTSIRIPILPTVIRENTDSVVRGFYGKIRAATVVLPDPLRPNPEVSAAQPRVRLRAWGLNRIVRAIIKALILAHIYFILTTSTLIFVYRFVDPSVTVLTAYRKWSSGWNIARPRPVRLWNVPGYVRRMIVAIEDDKFFVHHGFDLEGIQRAMRINSKIGKPMYGGSTLSMQTARTLFLIPFKSYLRKYLEVIVTVELELLLPKSRIFELYLSWAEWGKGVFGVEAAARKYYGVTVAKLGVEQSARLVALLSSPIRFSPFTLLTNRLLAIRYRYLVDAFD